MPEITQKRCAIYTRKSVEEGLEMEFNSLDAQREAGEAFILSQKANGWICLPQHYDDGGFSGGNTDRPALQQLLDDCEAGLVDMIVVYKIDRLSRSICDFADLTKRFDSWGVQFAAVTQDINTATSAGRMMLNILITFAQYEREVIAERVRDKMSASRLKGKWVGGNVPTGYDVVDKKLVINPEWADVVRQIFQRYIEVQSPRLIAMELNQQGCKTKQGSTWTTDYIKRILSNHTYVGEIKYKDAICKGEQEAIITREVWERCKEIQHSNSPAANRISRNEIIAPLKGILRCGHCGGAMIPTYMRKGSRRYYYYRCGKDAKRAEPTCPVRQVSAGEIESLIKTQLQKGLSDFSLVMRFAEQSGMHPGEVVDCFKEEFWQELSPGEYNRLMTLLIEKATVWENKLELELRVGNIRTFMEANNE